MMQKILRIENLIYAGVFLLALSLRLVSIGLTPLSDPEAKLALQALSLSEGQETILDSHPMYLVLSTLWMFLFGASQWTARFWPALAGSLLVLCPGFFRHQIGRLPALILAIILSLDPGLFASSITVGSPIIALFSLVALAGCMISGRVFLAGIAAGFALLSGPGLWIGLLGIVLAITVSRLLKILDTGHDDSGGVLVDRKFIWPKFIIIALATVFFAGTFFFSIPQGLSSFASGIPDFLSGWVKPGQTPVGRPLVGLLVYEFILLFLGIWGIINGLLGKDPVDRFLGVWWVISLGLVLLYPGRMMYDLIWSIVALATIAARQTVRMVNLAVYDRLPTLGQGILAGIILGFISLTILSIVNNSLFVIEQEYWIRIAGALIMLIASTGLIAWGWSREVSLRGLSWGFSALLMLFTVSSTWSVASFSNRAGYDFWGDKKVLSEEELLFGTIDQINQWSPATSGGQEIVVTGVASPALKWALRNMNKVKYSEQILPSSSPAIIITPDQPEIALSASYRGQSFTLREDIGWNYLRPLEWLRWLGFRVVPTELVLKERVILWARNDLFPGDEVELAPVQSPDLPQEGPN